MLGTEVDRFAEPHRPTRHLLAITAIDALTDPQPVRVPAILRPKTVTHHIQMRIRIGGNKKCRANQPIK